ncbi:MAG: aminotransferase class I/II-fold pyridoxal phosphate-dependent enzyme [Pirellulaceae bacterium]|nr:aminotransferase class I/II-fold pyridoxal phosphate-dependent enzyme [Pirellulaceae bacterium]
MTAHTPNEQARSRIRAAYDPELLRRAGHVLMDRLADHLAAVRDGAGPVLPWHHPPDSICRAADITERFLPPGVDRDALVDHFRELVATMLEHGLNLHHPRYIGHQVPAPVPIAGLFDAVGSITNQVMAIYDMGPWATAVEWAMVERLGEQIGWRPGAFSGLVTHGGSLANFTALLTARNVALPDCWERGIASHASPPVLVVQSDAHYCVSRAAGMLGMGTEQVVRVGLDSRRRMDPNRLDKTLAALRDENRRVVAVVACACSTPIGAFDPLEEIAEVCQRHEVWMHVDAAHGGCACLSSRYGHLVSGLHLADSLIWDAHKMLFVPGLCALVFYRNPKHRFETFRQDAPYLFDPAAPGLADYDSGLRTVECTKRAAAFGLWGVWSMFGPQLFADMVDVTFDMGRVLYEKLLAAPDFQPLHEPQCNIVVFRHVPPSVENVPPERLGRFQLELRRRVIESGDFYVVSTTIDGVGALRVTIINPLTTPDDLDQLLNVLRTRGAELVGTAQ